MAEPVSNTLTTDICLTLSLSVYLSTEDDVYKKKVFVSFVSICYSVT